MSDDDPPPRPSSPAQDGARVQQAARRSFFEIPPSLKRVFDRFPLLTYADNELPLRASSKKRGEEALYVFTTHEHARTGRPSYNPACLRWQTYLRLVGIPHRTVPSSNHASPTGALPFLLPDADDDVSALPVSSKRLKRWIVAQQKARGKGASAEVEDVRYEAYQSLLESRVRIAWLYQLYLKPANQPTLHRLYVAPYSSSPFVQMTVAHQLRQAAQAEIIKATGSSTVSESDIMRAAGEAMTALSVLLDDGDWFFAQAQAGIFDASVFAYTHLLLDGEMGWKENELSDMLKGIPNLVQHRERLARVYD